MPGDLGFRIERLSAPETRVLIWDGNGRRPATPAEVQLWDRLAELEAEVRRLYDLIDEERQDPRIAALLRESGR